MNSKKVDARAVFGEVNLLTPTCKCFAEDLFPEDGKDLQVPLVGSFHLQSNLAI